MTDNPDNTKAQEKKVEHIPTLAEYVAAGYQAETYGSRFANSVEPTTADAEDQPAKDEGEPMDRYYAVKTGDTFDGIAAELGRKDGGQELMDASHGGPTNGELAAGHFNRLAGADGEAVDGQGRLVRVLEPKDVTTKTKLVEGQSLLLPKGW